MIERAREVLAKAAAVAAGVSILASTAGAVSTPAQAQSAPNPYRVGTSAYWAWQNRPDLPPNLGDAKDWNDRAASQGWPVSEYPRPNDIAVFEPGAQGIAGSAGKVVVVKQVLDNGAFAATEMDEADCTSSASTCGRVNSRQYTFGPGMSFIHYMKDTRTTWGFASGASGWTASGMAAGTMDKGGWYYPLSTGKPALTSPELDIRLAGYNTIQVEMAVPATASGSALRMLFATAEQPSFSVDRSGSLGVVADGNVHNYRMYFRLHSGWHGQLKRLQIELPTGQTGGIAIKRIRLLNETSTIFTCLSSIVMAQ